MAAPQQLQYPVLRVSEKILRGKAERKGLWKDLANERRSESKLRAIVIPQRYTIIDTSDEDDPHTGSKSDFYSIKTLRESGSVCSRQAHPRHRQFLGTYINLVRAHPPDDQYSIPTPTSSAPSASLTPTAIVILPPTPFNQNQRVPLSKLIHRFRLSVPQHLR